MASLRHREKFNAAVYYLAVGEGNVRARLRHAYAQLRRLREDEVPAPLRAEWRSILNALTVRGPQRSSSGDIQKDALEHTLDRMRNTSGRRIAERIYAMVGHAEELLAVRRRGT